MKTTLPALSRIPALPLLFAAGLAQAAGLPVIEERAATQRAPVAVVAPASPAVASGSDAAVAVFEQLQQYQAQIEALTGRVEELEHQLKQARDQQRAQYVDLDGRVNALQQAKAVAAEPVGAVPAVPVVVVPPAAGDEKGLYESAQALVREKKFDDAIKVFEQQLKQYPRGELTPQAMYWLGELWLAVPVADAPKAGRYFYRVYNEYPKHARASASMYKHGLIQCQAAEVAKGRLTLNRLIVSHAGTPEAKLAEAALKQQCQ